MSGWDVLVLLSTIGSAAYVGFGFAHDRWKWHQTPLSIVGTIAGVASLLMVTAHTSPLAQPAPQPVTAIDATGGR